jgi:hypothetical protein
VLRLAEEKSRVGGGLGLSVSLARLSIAGTWLSMVGTDTLKQPCGEGSMSSTYAVNSFRRFPCKLKTA